MKKRIKLTESFMGSLTGFGSFKNARVKSISDKRLANAVNEISSQSLGLSGDASTIVSNIRQFYNNKSYLVGEYDRIDPSDGSVSAALDQYADSIIVIPEFNNLGVPYEIQSTSDKSVKAVEELFDYFGLSDKLWSIARYLCKYGDCYLVLTRKGDEVGIYQEFDAMRYSSFLIKNQEVIFDNYHQCFVDYDGNVGDISDEAKRNYYEVMNYDYVKVVHIGLTPMHQNLKQVDLMMQGNEVLSITSNDGSSILDPILVALRIMRLIEDMVLISRIDKSKINRIYQIEVGKKAQEPEVKKLINNFRNLISGRETMNSLSNNATNSSTSRILNEVIIPTREGIGSISIQDSSDDFNIGDLKDLKYFANKFYAGIKIPKVYLGYEEEAPTGFNNPLEKLDSRFNRAVKRISLSIEKGLTEVAQVYLEMCKKEYQDEELRVSLYKILTEEEINISDTYDKIITTIGSMVTTAKENDDEIDSTKAFKNLLEQMIPNFYRALYVDSESESDDTSDSKKYKLIRKSKIRTNKLESLKIKKSQN